MRYPAWPTQVLDKRLFVVVEELYIQLLAKSANQSSSFPRTWRTKQQETAVEGQSENSVLKLVKDRLVTQFHPRENCAAYPLYDVSRRRLIFQQLIEELFVRLV